MTKWTDEARRKVGDKTRAAWANPETRVRMAEGARKRRSHGKNCLTQEEKDHVSRKLTEHWRQVVEQTDPSIKQARELRAARRCRGYILKKYGLTVDDYERLWAMQKGKCAICRRELPDSKRLVVDHDHATGQVRGLLCPQCNHALGMVRDSPNVLKQAAMYLFIARGNALLSSGIMDRERLISDVHNRVQGT